MALRQDGDVCVTVWQDTRPVTFVSSAHNPADTTVVSREKKDNCIVHLDCPVCIVGYSKYMGGVDKGNIIMLGLSHVNITGIFLVFV